MNARERVLEWLAAREPPAPALLAQRLERFVRALPEARLDATMTRTMCALGLHALEGSLARGETGDAAALDLLAADAFVTYAFEAAAEEGLDVTPVAARLLAEVAR